MRTKNKMKLEKISAMTPTEYSNHFFINEIVSSLVKSARTAYGIGCGVGDLLFPLEEHDIKLSGIETSTESLAIAQKNGKGSYITFLQIFTSRYRP